MNGDHCRVTEKRTLTMKAILLAGAMTLAIVGNVQAGWFGLTEDYPYYKQSDDRSAFISTVISACVRNTYAEGNTLRLTSKQVLSYCGCRTEKLADVVTKTEIDYAIKFKNADAPSLVPKVVKAHNECIQEIATN
jgi:hypothetical protein